MKPRFVHTLVISVLAAVSVLRAGDAPSPPPSDVAQIPVVIRFVDQPVARVLEALFAATGARGTIDPCVGGRVTISLENVSMGVALETLAQVADLDVRRGNRGDVFHVTCRDVEGRRARADARLAGADTVTLEFRLEQSDVDGRSEVHAAPRLVARIGEPSEVSEPGRAPEYALADDGELIVRSRAPLWRIEAVVVATQSGGPREIHGLLEVSEAPREPEGTTTRMVKPFRATLAGVDEIPLAEMRGSRGTWTLILTAFR